MAAFWALYELQVSTGEPFHLSWPVETSFHGGYMHAPYILLSLWLLMLQESSGALDILLH